MTISGIFLCSFYLVTLGAMVRQRLSFVHDTPALLTGVNLRRGIPGLDLVELVRDWEGNRP